MEQENNEDGLEDPMLPKSHITDSNTAADDCEPASLFQLLQIKEFLDIILMICGAIAAIVTGASLPAFNVLFGSLINEINDTSSGFGSDINLLIHALIALAVVNLISGALQVYCWSYNGERQTRRLREWYIRSILRQEIGWFDTCGAGELSTRLADLCGQVQDGIGRKLGDMQQYFVQVVASFAASFYLSWELTIVLIGTVPFIGLAGWFMIVAATAAQNASSDQYAAAGGVATEALGAARTVTALNAQPYFIQKYRQHLIDAMNVGIEKGRKVGLGNGLLFGVCFLTYSLGFWYGARLVARDIDHECSSRCATGGKIISVFFCVIVGAVGVGQLAPPVNAFFTAKAAAGKMLSVCKRKPLIDGLSIEGYTPESDVQGNIELKGVRFAYPSRPDAIVCDNYNLCVDSGEVVALCGMSGCGKSTIMNLLLRFYDPQEGQLLLDGIDTKLLNIRWLRSKIGYVGQEPVLFSGTIAENIAYGIDRDINTTISEDEIRQRVIEASKLSYAHDFISQFPDGYETRVGTSGVALSGGQKQRIAIARALVKRPAILLLDEATSALDAASEQMVQQSIDSLQQSRAQTTLIIAHRLSTIRNADRIALISDGQVAELGSHDELITRNGKYADLVRLQMTTTGSDSRQENDSEKNIESRLPIASSTPAAPTLVETIGSGLRNASRSMSFTESDIHGLLRPDKEDPDGISKEEKSQLNKRVWKMILQHPMWLFIGLLGAACFGAVFPLWGMILAKAENMFFYEDTDKMRRKATVQAIYFAALGAVSLVSCTLQYWGVAQVGERISAQLRSDLFEAYMRRGIAFFDREENSAGDLCSRLADDSRTVHKAGGEALAKQLQAAFTLAVGCVIGFTASWRIALVVIACFPANIIASAVQMQAIAGQQYDTEEDDDGQFSVLASAFTNMRTVSAFSMQYRISEKYCELTKGVSTARLRRALLAGIGFGASNMSLFLTYTLLFWYGQRLMNRDLVTFQNMMISIFSLMLGALGLGQALIDIGDQNEGLRAARRIFKALDDAKADPLDGMSREGASPIESCQGAIELQGVSFAYPTRQGIDVCKNINLSIAAGEVVAVVGPSGSGKSTIMSLLLRFYDPVSGNVLIDGHRISELNVRWLRAQIGYVGQEPVLFNGTIFENIKLGYHGMDKMTCPSLEEVISTVSREKSLSTRKIDNVVDSVTYHPPDMYKTPNGDIESTDSLENIAVEHGVSVDIIRACMTSNAHSFISNFPERYDTNVGEGSIMVSGGQKQRIAIARALVKRPAILLLDEATSALDAASEQMVQQSIDSLQQSRAQTTLIIAHRLSTIRNADRIVVMDKGVVVEEGTHDSLLENRGLYSVLWNKQQGHTD